MSNDLVALREEQKTMDCLCNQLLETKHYNKIGYAGLYAIMAKAKALGLNPLNAINDQLYYVHGRVEMLSSTMNQLIRMAGHSITKDPKSNDEICILHGRRVDNGDTWTESFSIAEAKRAGLVKHDSGWMKYPRDMLFARALSRLARQLFPDVIKGCYVRLEVNGEAFDEIQDFSECEVVHEISAEQANELFERIKPFKKYKDELDAYLKSHYNIVDYKSLTPEIYSSILKRIAKLEAENPPKEEPIEDAVARVLNQKMDEKPKKTNTTKAEVQAEFDIIV